MFLNCLEKSDYYNVDSFLKVYEQLWSINKKNDMRIYECRLYWKTVADTSFHEVDVAVPAYTIDNISPNSQYIVYIVALSKNGKSLPSETLIAWTDPAYPAFVEVCTMF